MEEVIQISKEELYQLIRKAVREELELILKDILLDIIRYEPPEEDEIQYVEEKIIEEDYIELDELSKKYKTA